MTKLNKPVYVSGIELNISQAQTSEETENYELLCFDGYAMGSNGILNVVMKYPALSQLSEEQMDKAMTYSFGRDWEKEGLAICFRDVMMLYGKVTQLQQVNTI
jgi:hypothetical protein